MLPLLLIMTANQSERAIDKNGGEIQIWAWVPNRRFYSYIYIYFQFKDRVLQYSPGWEEAM